MASIDMVRMSTLVVSMILIYHGRRAPSQLGTDVAELFALIYKTLMKRGNTSGGKQKSAWPFPAGV